MLVKVHTSLQVFVMTKEVPLMIIYFLIPQLFFFLDLIKCFSATSFKVTGFKHFKFECYPNAYKSIHIYSLTTQWYRVDKAQNSQNFPTRPSWILGWVAVAKYLLWFLRLASSCCTRREDVSCKHDVVAVSSTQVSGTLYYSVVQPELHVQTPLSGLLQDFSATSTKSLKQHTDWWTWDCCRDLKLRHSCWPYSRPIPRYEPQEISSSDLDFVGRKPIALAVWEVPWAPARLLGGWLRSQGPHYGTVSFLSRCSTFLPHSLPQKQHYGVSLSFSLAGGFVWKLVKCSHAQVVW